MSVNKTKLISSIQKRGGYFQGPNEIWEIKGLSMKAKVIYLYLLAQSDNWNPGLKGIATGTSVSINTARAAIKELEDNKMIEVETHANGLRNIYTFTSLEEWVCQAGAEFDAAQQVVFPKSTPQAGAEFDRATVSTIALVPYQGLHAPNKNIILTNNTNREVSVESLNSKESGTRVPYYFQTPEFLRMMDEALIDCTPNID